MMARPEDVLRRYWFTFRDPPASGYSFGCGVTAFDYDDAIALLREKVFAGDLPEIESVEEDVDVTTLDEGHVQPNIGPPNWRGVWYPSGFADSRARTRPLCRGPLVMQPPIVVEADDLMIFDAQRDAERYLEAIDVEEGRHRAWDSEGRPLVVRVVERRKKGLFRTRMVEDVVVEQEGDGPTHAEQLRNVLTNALRRVEKLPASSEPSLPELIQEARRWFLTS